MGLSSLGDSLFLSELGCTGIDGIDGDLSELGCTKMDGLMGICLNWDLPGWSGIDGDLSDLGCTLMGWD